jgi:predicted flap endonuclease-1-like 5' DNA nuclease
MTYPISDIEGIGPEAADALKSVGIRTTIGLLRSAQTPKQRLHLADRTGLDEKKILSWANAADRMRIRGVGADYAELMRVAGVDTVKELRYRNPGKLAEALVEANSKRKLVRLLPSEHTVKRWIEIARKLPMLISY